MYLVFQFCVLELSLTGRPNYKFACCLICVLGVQKINIPWQNLWQTGLLVTAVLIFFKEEHKILL